MFAKKRYYNVKKNTQNHVVITFFLNVLTTFHRNVFKTLLNNVCKKRYNNVKKHTESHCNNVFENVFITFSQCF